MKLITLYKALLELGGMSSDRDGLVSGKLPGAKEDPRPVTIKGKRLVLPTQKQLTTSDWSDRIVFHPLYENVLRGESQVIEVKISKEQYERDKINLQLEGWNVGLYQIN